MSNTNRPAVAPDTWAEYVEDSLVASFGCPKEPGYACPFLRCEIAPCRWQATDAE